MLSHMISFGIEVGEPGVNGLTSSLELGKASPTEMRFSAQKQSLVEELRCETGSLSGNMVQWRVWISAKLLKLYKPHFA